LQRKGCAGACGRAASTVNRQRCCLQPDEDETCAPTQVFALTTQPGSSLARWLSDRWCQGKPPPSQGKQEPAKQASKVYKAKQSNRPARIDCTGRNIYIPSVPPRRIRQRRASAESVAIGSLTRANGHRSRAPARTRADRSFMRSFAVRSKASPIRVQGEYLTPTRLP